MFDLIPEVRGGSAEEKFEEQLLAADWNDALGPLRLNGDLRADELTGATFYQNAWVLLKALLEENGTKATPTGNLNRKFFGRIFQEMKLFDATRDVCTVYEVLDERSVWPVRQVRLLCAAAGLIERKEGRIDVTELGRSLMKRESAGALYRHLFISYFRDFDWRCDRICKPVPEVQRTAAVSLWRLNKATRANANVTDLVTVVLRPDTLKAVKGRDKKASTWGFTLLRSLFDPLAGFGLVRLEEPDNEWATRAEYIVRLTSLWNRFIHFASLQPGL
jgi:hypothetical protein